MVYYHDNDQDQLGCSASDSAYMNNALSTEYVVQLFTTWMGSRSMLSDIERK
jgi:hypothetical protein